MTEYWISATAAFPPTPHHLGGAPTTNGILAGPSKVARASGTRVVVGLGPKYILARRRGEVLGGGTVKAQWTDLFIGLKSW